MIGIAAAWMLLAASVFPAQHQSHAADPAGWSWRVDAQAFLNANLQVRKFTDFYGIESQNWIMASVSGPVGRGRLSVHGMASVEDWTLPLYGSPQVFQTGETYAGAALTDYQHPHDLVMAASARFEQPAGAWRLTVAGGLVDAPALGPEPFMHRSSAEGNPTTPLGHHSTDSTHITHGVVSVGAARGAWALEASAFHGREPDEDRVAIEFGPIDSYAARVTWRRGAWQAHASGGFLKYPDPTEATDNVVVTGSVSYSPADRPFAAAAIFGLSREAGIGVTEPAVILEAAWRRRPADLLFGRLEFVRKDILTQGGYDPPGFPHPHVLSDILALTLGYERRLVVTRAGSFGLGADATGYLRDRNLDDNYGWPFSAHVFLRYRFAHASPVSTAGH